MLATYIIIVVVSSILLVGAVIVHMSLCPPHIYKIRRRSPHLDDMIFG